MFYCSRTSSHTACPFVVVDCLNKVTCETSSTPEPFARKSSDLSFCRGETPTFYHAQKQHSLPVRLRLQDATCYLSPEWHPYFRGSKNSASLLVRLRVSETAALRCDSGATILEAFKKGYHSHAVCDFLQNRVFGLTVEALF